METSLLTEVKAILKSLVLSCPEKITVEQLNRDYRDVEGQFIPYRQLGYGNLDQFLHSITDTLRVFGSGPTAMVCFVANEKSDHIHDMIMKQRKPKSKGRTGSRRRRKSNNAIERNRIYSNTQQPSKNVGQQLSPYQSVNRNTTTRSIQIRERGPYGVQTFSHAPAFVSYQTFPTLPNSTLLYPQQYSCNTRSPVLSSIKNGLIKSAGNQSHNYEKQVSHVSNLLTKQCNVSNPPPPLPRQQNRIVKFSPPTKKEHLQDESTEIKKNETIILPDEIKATKAKKQIPIKLSDDVESLLSMPKLSKVINPIVEPTTNLSVDELPKEKNVEHVKQINEPKTAQSNSNRFFDNSANSVDDPDEAVPSFAAKNNVFRLDFPEYTVPYGSKLPTYELSDDITVGSCIKIFISEIHNPFKFWFHIHKDNHELDLLMYQIERYYSTLDSEDMRIPTVCLTPGQVCAACYNGLWHRAEIVAPPVNTSIKVSFMDYGTVTEVEIKDVKFLGSYFAKLPAQALRGCLSHIKPRTLHWRHDATTYFLTLVAELMLYAKITEIDREKNVLYMILCDTNGGEIVQINKSLVENRYAFYDEEWKTEKINQNNGKRIHHPREDFPTFSMIESGEYPNFPELVSLQQRGIDYEAIYDIIIYNQSTILNKHESASERLRSLPYFLTTSNPFRSEILWELYATTSKAI